MKEKDFSLKAQRWKNRFCFFSELRTICNAQCSRVFSSESPHSIIVGWSKIGASQSSPVNSTPNHARSHMYLRL